MPPHRVLISLYTVGTTRPIDRHFYNYTLDARATREEVSIPASFSRHFLYVLTQWNTEHFIRINFLAAVVIVSIPVGHSGELDAFVFEPVQKYLKV